MHNDTPLGAAMHLKELDRHAAPKLGPLRAGRPEAAAVTAARSALMALLRRLDLVGSPAAASNRG